MFVTNSYHNIIRLYEYADLDMNSVSDEMYMGYTVTRDFDLSYDSKVMIRVILAPNDVLTPFDLRAQNFRVIVEFSTCHRGQKFFSKKCPKVTFRLEKKF